MDVASGSAGMGRLLGLTRRSGPLWNWVLVPGWASGGAPCRGWTFHSKEIDRRSGQMIEANLLHPVTSDNPHDHGRCCRLSRLAVSSLNWWRRVFHVVPHQLLFRLLLPRLQYPSHRPSWPPFRSLAPSMLLSRHRQLVKFHGKRSASDFVDISSRSERRLLSAKHPPPRAHYSR